MFTVIQSNDTQILAKHLSTLYQKPLAKGGSIFDPFLVIVPAMVLDEWLKKTIAKHSKISTLITTQFWGQYQWQLIDKVLKCDTQPKAGQALSVPDMAVLSQAVIRWRIFTYLMSEVNTNGEMTVTLATLALGDDTHPLHELLSTLTDPSGVLGADVLWRFCETLARLYVQYLTERTDWLHRWAMGGRLDVLAMIAKKDALSQTLNRPEWQEPQSTDDEHATPAWLSGHYVALERALAFLWQTLFAQVFLYRERLETRFWELLADKTHPNYANICQTLPKTIHLFTVQQLPQTELDFLKKLSSHTDVVLLHFNPSAMFWADIVDKNWLATQRIIRPEAVYLKDYGHGLLSRLGKASRETFAMLVDMAGGEYSPDFVVDWQDDFNEFADNFNNQPSLLTALKKDIAMLEETALTTTLADGLETHWQTQWQTHLDNLTHKQKPASTFVPNKADDSLLIHNCHSIKRELEVARAWIGRWLNEPNADGTRRKLSDVAIMLPDVESHRELLSVMFSDNVGLDGLVLPAKITGIQDKEIGQLWSGMAGLFDLTAGRFYYQTFCEWLLNPYVYQAFGMDMAMALRACELLRQAGFVRGLNEKHLKTNLNKHDTDYRTSFAYALDRLVVSLALADGLTDVLYPFAWQADSLSQKTATLSVVRLEDEAIVQALCRIYHAFGKTLGRYEDYRLLQEWLVWLEFDVIECYFYRYKGEEVMRGIFEIINRLKASLKANVYYAKFDGANTRQPAPYQPKLPLKFVLETIATAIASQKISAETSDVIQIGRFGSLRGISFGLVVMAGMDLSEFPRSEPISRLDLSKAGLPRRGDRVGEDDDNGAFLEALLQARENCWIFYSGQTASNQGERLPATPVGELIQFIKNSTPQVEQKQSEPWFVIKHPALPFERTVFEQVGDHQALSPMPSLQPPPAKLWQAIYGQSGQAVAKPSAIALPSQDELASLAKLIENGELESMIDTSAPIVLETLIRQITKPHRTYLTGRMARHKDQEDSKEEALHLDALSNYQVSELLLSRELALHKELSWHKELALHDDGQTLTRREQEAFERLLFEPLLPAGASKDWALSQTQNKVGELMGRFFANQATFANQSAKPPKSPPTPTEYALHTVKLFGASQPLTVLAKLPTPDESSWQSVQFGKFNAERQVRAFIYHLVWQLVRNDKSDTAQAGTSFWQFMPNDKHQDHLRFAPMSYEQASVAFARFLLFAELVKRYPIALTPDTALAQILADEPTVPSENTLRTWLNKPYGTSYTPDSSSFHADWQRILGKADPKTALTDALVFVSLLYTDFLTTLIK